MDGPDGVQGSGAGTDGTDAPQAPGENDHLRCSRVQLAQGAVRRQGDAVTAGDDGAVEAHGADLHAGAAQQVAGNDSFGLFKAVTKKQIYHNIIPPDRP